eukprot:6490264-Amphidinium_carterae.6
MTDSAALIREMEKRRVGEDGLHAKVPHPWTMCEVLCAVLQPRCVSMLVVTGIAASSIAAALRLRCVCAVLVFTQEVSYIQSRMAPKRVCPVLQGFANLGSSCFINASSHGLFSSAAVRAVLDTAVVSTERKLQVALHSAQTSKHPIVPRPITAEYYHNVQGDAAEFLTNLLSTCPQLSMLTKGVEASMLSCQHCTFSRASEPEPIGHLMLSLIDEGIPLTSVQQALDMYLNAS